MEATDLKLKLAAVSNDGPAIAINITAMHPFRDGHSVTEEIIGRRVTVVFPSVDYKTLDVKVSDPTDALTPILNKNRPVYVDFDNFEAHIYDFTDKATGVRRMGISAKADAVRVVPGPTAFDDLEVG